MILMRHPPEATRVEHREPQTEGERVAYLEKRIEALERERNRLGNIISLEKRGAGLVA